MSKLLVTIEKIIDIQPIIGADRIMLATVKGWNSIIGKGQFNVGDLCIYIPIDAVLPDSLIESQKLEYLKGNNRIRTIKLKGTISQGLILPISVLDSVTSNHWVNIQEEQDVANILNITKYEPPQKALGVQSKESIHETWKKYQAKEITFRRFFFKSLGILKSRCKKPKLSNPEFKEYTDINNIKHYPEIFEEGEMVVITEKIHGCLNSNSEILLFDGTTRKIKDIVDNKLNILLASRNNEGKIVPSRITNWFNNGYTKNWKKLAFSRTGLKGNDFGKIICTSYHKFLKASDDEFYNVDNLNINDKIYVQQQIFDIPKIIKDVLIGKMLGDGSFDKCHNSISFGHKIDHKEYVLHTLSYLGFLAGNLQKLRISGFGTTMCRARTKSDESIKILFKNWYKTNHKQIPYIKLSPISLAFWYMDDGSLSHHNSQKDRACFATCGFNENSIDNLIEALKEIGLEGQKYFSDGKYWRIRLNTDSAYKMFYMIAPYIPKCMRYKLPEELRNLPESPIFTFNKPQFKTILTIQSIISIEDYDCKKDNQTKYDLETEYHNYIANGIVVHNSNFRVGHVPIKTNLLTKLLRKGTHEFVYGSHHVQKTCLSGKGFYGDDVYGQIAAKYGLRDLLPNGYVLYGEIYGPKIQELTYGLSEIDVVFFDLQVNGKYVDYMEFYNFCVSRHLPTAPLLYLGMKHSDTIAKYTDGKTTIGKGDHIREGCVVKPLNEAYSNKCGRKILKSVSADYLLARKVENPEEYVDDNPEFNH